MKKIALFVIIALSAQIGAASFAQARENSSHRRHECPCKKKKPQPPAPPPVPPASPAKGL